MKNKAAIVTGASRGIGLAVAAELAGMGYSLGLVARSNEDIKKAAMEIEERFPSVSTVTGAFDVADSLSIDDFVRHVCSEIGDISVLVNNAGEYKPGTSVMPAELTERMMDVNFLAATRFVQAVLPSMKKTGNGYVFNVASICGVEAFPDVGNYCASKFALVGYSSSLAQELAPMGIKVTALCPDWVNTRQAINAPMKQEEMIQTSDIAATVRYLLSLGRTAAVREIVIHCK